MELVLVLAIFVGLALATHLFGADTRPGFVDGRSDRVEHWFPHSRTD